MPSGSLIEISARLGELTGTMRALAEKVDAIQQNIADSEDRSTESRANVHRRLDELVVRTTHIEQDVLTTKVRVENVEVNTNDRLQKVELVTDGVQIMRERALGAGTAGRWLIKIGIGVVTFAGWVLAGYTYLTGRPPP
jgi:hypothetical protein